MYPVHVRKTCTFAVNPIFSLSRSPQRVSLRDIQVSCDTANLSFPIPFPLFLSWDENCACDEINSFNFCIQRQRRRRAMKKSRQAIRSLETRVSRVSFSSRAGRFHGARIHGHLFPSTVPFSLIRPVRMRITDNGRAAMMVESRQRPKIPLLEETVMDRRRNGEERPAKEHTPRIGN